MWKSLILAFLVMLGLAAPADLPGQESADPASILLDLDTGDRIRVLAPPDTTVEGRVASIYVRSLVLDLDSQAGAGSGGSQWTTDFGAIDALWTRGRQTWLGAAIGGGVGLIFFGLAASVGSGLCEYDCDTSAGDYVIGGLLFGGAGAALGALVGTAFPRWSLKYER
jgi:hypothetical protein